MVYGIFYCDHCNMSFEDEEHALKHEHCHKVEKHDIILNGDEKYTVNVIVLKSMPDSRGWNKWEDDEYYIADDIYESCKLEDGRQMYEMLVNSENIDGVAYDSKLVHFVVENGCDQDESKDEIEDEIFDNAKDESKDEIQGEN